MVLDGIEYVRASVIAKRFRYTADYVGQLCRNKKIDARLVGRSWYVNPLSMDEYRAGRHQKREATQQTEFVAEESANITHTQVQPSLQRSVAGTPLKSATLKILADQQLRQQGARRSLRVTYEPDHGNLIPTLTKRETRPPKYIHIQPAESKKLGISSSRAHHMSSFAPTEMPEVALSGKIPVLDYPDAEATLAAPDLSAETIPDVASDRRNIFKNKDISDKPVSTESLDVNVHGTDTALAKVGKTKRIRNSANLVQEAQMAETPANLPTGDFLTKVSLEKGIPHVVGTVPDKKTVSSFSPKSVTLDEASYRTSSLVLFSPVIATVMALVVVVLLFLSSLQVTVTNDNSDSRLVFQMASLLDFLRQ